MMTYTDVMLRHYQRVTTISETLSETLQNDVNPIIDSASDEVFRVL